MLSAGVLEGLAPDSLLPSFTHILAGALFSALPLAASTDTSIASTNFASTWLCLQVYRPFPSASLQADRTWLRVWTPPRSGQLLSCTTAHLARLAAAGSWSYTALIMKLRRRGAMCQISVHDILRCKASSQVVHWPCWLCCMAVCSLSCSTCDLTSSITKACLSLADTLDHHFCLLSLPYPRPSLFVCVAPMISFSLADSSASWIALCTFHFLPVFNTGSMLLIAGSLECMSISCSRDFATLYSSVIAFRGSRSLLLLLYSATGGRPSHFLV